MILAMLAGMTVAIVYQMGHYGRSMYETHTVLAASSTRRQEEKPVISVKKPVIPAKKETSPPIDVSLPRQNRAQPRKINTEVVTGDIARMIANKLAKQYDFNPNVAVAETITEENKNNVLENIPAPSEDSGDDDGTE